MKNKTPLVSIILPVCNAEAFLTTCVKSLFSQTYQCIEIIAIDDASKDKSFSILKELRSADTRLRAYKNKKRYGLAISLNRGLKRARGTFLTFMNPQDKSSVNRIKKQVKFLLSNPKVAAVGCQCTVIDENNKRLGKSNFPKYHEEIFKALVPGLSMEFETAMINRNLLPKDLLKFIKNPHPLIYADVFMKMAIYGKLANLKEFLHYHRKNLNESYKTVRTIPNLISLWIRSILLYEKRPPIGSLLTTLKTTSIR